MAEKGIEKAIKEVFPENVKHQRFIPCQEYEKMRVKIHSIKSL